MILSPFLKLTRFDTDDTYKLYSHKKSVYRRKQKF